MNSKVPGSRSGRSVKMYYEDLLNGMKDYWKGAGELA